jgi:hypothetical protein
MRVSSWGMPQLDTLKPPFVGLSIGLALLHAD